MLPEAVSEIMKAPLLEVPLLPEFTFLFIGRNTRAQGSGGLLPPYAGRWFRLRQLGAMVVATCHEKSRAARDHKVISHSSPLRLHHRSHTSSALRSDKAPT